MKEWMKKFVALLTNQKKLWMNGNMMTFTFFELYIVYINKLGQIFSHTYSLNNDASVLLKVINIWEVPLREVSKYGVVSGPYFPTFGLNTGKYGPEIIVIYLRTDKPYTIYLKLLSRFTDFFSSNYS